MSKAIEKKIKKVSCSLLLVVFVFNVSFVAGLFFKTSVVLADSLPECSLELKKNSTGYDYVYPGDEIAYDFSITNTGDGVCNDFIRIVDVYSENAVYLDQESSVSPVVGSDDVEWVLDSLASGESEFFSVSLKISDEAVCGNFFTNKISYSFGVETDQVSEEIAIECPSYCGDGVLDVDGNEECDDGNDIDNDECSKECKIISISTCDDGEEDSCCINNGDSSDAENCESGLKTCNDGVWSECVAEVSLDKSLIAPLGAVLPDSDLCDVPVDVVIAMDRSFSMSYDNPTRLSQAKSAADTFLESMGPSDQSSLVYFSYDETPQNPYNDPWIAFLDKRLSNDHDLTASHIDALTADGPTNIGDAIILANEELTSERANPMAVKVIILLTDGRANMPNGNGLGEDLLDVAYATSTVQQAASLGHKIFTIGLGDSINEDMLSYISAQTDAKYYFSPSASDLEEIYMSIGREICNYGSISGYKYIDSNKDGDIQGEQVDFGWEIILNDDTNRVQTTDSSGFYLFSGLLPGEYKISELGKNGVVFSQTYLNNNLNNDGSAYTLTLGYGEDITNVDFGNYVPECGNGYIDSGFDGYSDEQCDDGNKINGDGCSETCVQEICTAPTTLVINEIMYNSSFSVNNNEGEWFELYNTGTSSIDLMGCTVGDKNLDFFTIESSLIIDGGGYLVLSKNASTTINGGLTPDYAYGDSLVLENADELIITCCGTEIDIVEYSSARNFPEATSSSILLSDPYLDNNIGENWCISSSVYGDGDLGTPGAKNDTCAVYQPSCGNGILDTGYIGYSDEECDDGNLLNGDGCSSSCVKEGGGGTDEEEHYCGDGVVDTGETCDDGNTVGGDGCSSKCILESSGGYFKYSGQGGGSVSEENEEEVLVLGEEGAPILEVSKKISKDVANPGDKGIEYLVTIKNTGNLTAFSVSLVDTLMDGLNFQNEESGSKTWAIGDILPNESKSVSYLVDIDSDAESKVYANKAVVSALNHEDVYASADLLIESIETLPETGFDLGELHLLLFLSLSMFGASTILKRKEASLCN